MNYYKGSISDIIKRALREDIGKGDITTAAIIPEDKYVKAILLAEENCVICGLDTARKVFTTQDKNIEFKPHILDGQKIKKGKIIAHILGRAQGILTAERVALNFLSLLSGVATKTRAYADKVKPYGVKILDTRKTIPGLRELEKYAVRIGGGFNHRLNLDEMILIKDNHLKVIGDRLWVMGLKEIKNKITPKIKIEVEVKTLKEFKKALKINPDIIMLDNMNLNAIKKAVKLRNNLSPITYHLSPKLEASGGITLKNVRAVASTGVDMISIGALTHSINSVDISLEIF